MDPASSGNSPAVFLDRDGTLVEETGYLNHPEQLKLLPGVGPALRKLKERGFLLIVVTNQSAIARGWLREEQLAEIHRHLQELLAREGVQLDGIYYCPHHPEAPLSHYRQNCQCRKPEAGLIFQAARDFAVDLSRSFMVGDKTSDVLAGQAAGVRTVLVRTGYGRQSEARLQAMSLVPDFIGDDLPQAVRWILQQPIAPSHSAS